MNSTCRRWMNTLAVVTACTFVLSVASIEQTLGVAIFHFHNDAFNGWIARADSVPVCVGLETSGSDAWVGFLSRRDCEV